MGVAGRSHRHRARDRAYTTRAYMLAREPGWAQIARLGADRTGGRGLGGGSGGESVWGWGSGSTPALARIQHHAVPKQAHLRARSLPASRPSAARQQRVVDAPQSRWRSRRQTFACCLSRKTLMSITTLSKNF